jgi:hypothetical protein
MGGHGDLGMGPEGVLRRQRLGAEDVERGMADLPAVEGGEKRVVVDQRSAAGVHDDRAFRQEREGAGVQGVFRGGRVGQEQDDDLRPGAAWRRAHPAMGGLDAFDGLGRPRPAQHPEVQRRQRLCAGRAEDAKAQHRHRAVARQRRSGARAPHPVLAVDMGVHAQVVAQDVAGDPLHHAFGQAVIDHPRQRDLERGVAGHILHPGPEVQDRLEPREGREIRQAAVRGVDDVVDLRRGGLGRERGTAEPGLVQGRARGASYCAQRSDLRRRGHGGCWWSWGPGSVSGPR